MPIQFINRRGKTYTLYQGKSKSDAPRYFFSMKAEGEAAEAIPEGYEIYENPQARVFLRKIPLRLIRDSERALIEKHLPGSPGRFLVDIKGKTITVYESGRKNLQESFRPLASPGMISARKTGRSPAAFSPVIRFTLQDAEKRRFILEHHYLKTSNEEWTQLAGPSDLGKLAKNYLKYLGE